VVGYCRTCLEHGAESGGIGSRCLHLAEHVLSVVSIHRDIKVIGRELAGHSLCVAINFEAFHTACFDNFFYQVQALLAVVTQCSAHGPLEELRLQLLLHDLANNRDILGVMISAGVSLHLIVVHSLLVPFGPDGSFRR